MKAARARRRAPSAAHRGLDGPTVELLCTALGHIANRLTLVHSTAVALAVDFDLRNADPPCVRCLRCAVAEPLLYQLNLLRNLAYEVARSLDRGPAGGRSSNASRTRRGGGPAKAAFGDRAAGRAP